MTSDWEDLPSLPERTDTSPISIPVPLPAAAPEESPAAVTPPPPPATEPATPNPAPAATPAPNPTPAPTPAAPAPPTAAEALAAAVERLPQPDGIKIATRHLGGCYDRSDVDAFLGELTATIGDVRSALERERAELAELRAERAQLQAENAKLRASAAMSSDLEQEVTLGAVGLLSQAQTIADKAVADAEQYARDLVLAARAEYREAAERAAEAAEQAAGQLDAAGIPAVPAPAVMPPMPEIDYVRTYAKVAQVQLRSVLDALTEQVDRLGTLPEHPERAENEIVAPAPAVDDEVPDEEPNWIPDVPPQPTIQRQSYISPMS